MYRSVWKVTRVTKVRASSFNIACARATNAFAIDRNRGYGRAASVALRRVARGPDGQNATRVVRAGDAIPS
eukprot:5856105-Pleurochrysis_carterae.AAC.1